MITALIIMHFFGGGTPVLFTRSDFRTVNSSIEEPERAEAATEAMERMNELLESVVDKRMETRDQLSEIDHSVTSREGSYDKIIDELWQVRREARQQYIDEVFTMREFMTRDEWNAAFGNTEE